MLKRDTRINTSSWDCLMLGSQLCYLLVAGRCPWTEHPPSCGKTYIYLPQMCPISLLLFITLMQLFFNLWVIWQGFLNVCRVMLEDIYLCSWASQLSCLLESYFSYHCFFTRHILESSLVNYYSTIYLVQSSVFPLFPAAW